MKHTVVTNNSYKEAFALAKAVYMFSTYLDISFSPLSNQNYPEQNNEQDEEINLNNLELEKVSTNQLLAELAGMMAKFEELDLKDDIDDDIRSISDNMVLVNNHFVGNNLSEDILLKDIEITNNDGSVNFSALIEYCTQNKAYTSKNMLRIKANIQLTNQNSNTNTNPSTIRALTYIS
jgi:hypothetical protein